jgi:hypothetical protein
LRLPPHASKERYELAGQAIANWEKARPSSPVWPLVKVGHHLDLAWKWRGTGPAKTVKPEQWEGFRSELATARQLLEANPPTKAYPQYYVLMQTVALGQSWPKDKYMVLLAEAVRVSPEYYRFYSNTARYLLPWWNGAPGEWEAFAEQQRQANGAGGAGDALYARIAWSMHEEYGCCDQLFRESKISWDIMASGFEYLIREHPDSRFLKNVYANFAWKAHDPARLRTALPAVQDDPDMTVWVNLENVALAKKVAAAP